MIIILKKQAEEAKINALKKEMEMCIRDRFMDDQPILSCSMLAARVDGHKIDTLEGLQEESAEFGAFIANQGLSLIHI